MPQEHKPNDYAVAGIEPTVAAPIAHIFAQKIFAPDCIRFLDNRAREAARQTVHDFVADHLALRNESVFGHRCLQTRRRDTRFTAKQL